MTEDQQPEDVEYSAGGSRIHRYSGGEFDNPEIRVPPEEHHDFQQKRERVFDSVFGDSENVFHEVLPLFPHIDVYVHAPTEQRDFYTLVTGGMSNDRMTLPQGVPTDFARAELVFYCNEPKPEYAELLRKLAHFPHDNRTWLSYGHTMPNGQPPEPIFENPQLDTLILLGSIVAPDSTFEEQLSLNGDPVNLLWLLPISTPECQYKLDHGADAFYEILDKNQHPFVFEPDRQSYL